MNAETRTCRNCQNTFTVEPDDFSFYERMKVPAPTWCPECRMVRKITWRNERSLYREQCAQCGASTLSVYVPGHQFPVYCHDCWASDKWEGGSYGRDYDFSRPFFMQFQELFNVVPRQAVFVIDVANSPYTNFAAWGKNLYLSYSALNSDDVYYSKIVGKSHVIFDSYDLNNSENCYENNQGDRNYRVFFSLNSRDSIDSSFLYNCANCRNCFMSANLRNAEFVFRGVQYSEADYATKLKSVDFGSFKEIEGLKNEFKTMVSSSLHRYANIVKSVNSTGNDLLNTKDARAAFSGYNLENVRYSFRVFDAKDSYDTIHLGPNVERIYEFVGGGAKDGSNIAFSMNCSGGSRDLAYCDFCSASSNCFGCVGLKNKQYCILNKQYTKEEYEELVPRIIAHMDEMPYEDGKGKTYTYGEFFPSELSPFSYNETTAQEYFPLTKEEALRKGYRWRDPDTKQYQITKQPKDLPDHIKDVIDDILRETIGCAHGGTCAHQCTTAFKIIPEELAFYRRMNLPLPRLCPNCRHYERLAQRNPLKLWHRQCMCDKAHPHHTGHCSNEFETSYAPERPETVYCEQCYNAEVV